MNRSGVLGRPNTVKTCDARSPAAQPQPRRPWYLRQLKVEHGLMVSGLASAVASCGFAAFMIVHNTGLPNVQGGEYFSVFAKMDRTLRARALNAAALANEGAPAGKADIDPIVTGSIGARRSIDPMALPLPGFSLREAFGDTALIDTPAGVQVVHAGSILVGAGRVTAIERRGPRMVVVTDRGIVVGEVD